MSRLFFRDVIYSVSYGKIKYLAFFAIAACLTIMKSVEIKPFSANSVDVMFLMLQDNGTIRRAADYQVPFYWEFIQFFPLILIGDFLHQDESSNRTYLLLRCRSKIRYMTAKIGWMTWQSGWLFILLFFLIYVLSSLILGDFSLGSSSYFHQQIMPMMEAKASPASLFVHLFIGFVVTTMVLSALQLLCIQFISPIATLFIMICLCSLSTFSSSKWLPAIHSMILKRNFFDTAHHFTLGFSVAYSLLVYVLACVFAIYAFVKKDIL